MNMDEKLFERCFVVIACERARSKFGSNMAYAKKIWPEKEDKTAAQTLYALLGKSSKTGKPQNLRLHEAVRMVNLLDSGVSFPSFCFEVAEKIRIGWSLDDIEPKCKGVKSELGNEPAKAALPPSSEQHANNGSHEST